jgi:DNA-binding NarL/FixJ family response regulator
VAKKAKAEANAKSELTNEPSIAVELGRIAKLFALFLTKDVEDETTKILRLNGAGFSSAEIAALLDKTENNVRVQISKAKTKKGE